MITASNTVLELDLRFSQRAPAAPNKDDATVAASIFAAGDQRPVAGGSGMTSQHLRHQLRGPKCGPGTGKSTDRAEANRVTPERVKDVRRPQACKPVGATAEAGA